MNVAQMLQQVSYAIIADQGSNEEERA